ncbi:MAG: hypothetical protein Crog4KO_23560 [Crocinitomicaceae bacterium]
MPIEVRELIIRTTVDRGAQEGTGGNLSEEGMRQLKKRVMKDCKELIQREVKKNSDR